jgi:hypothetical protein
MDWNNILSYAVKKVDKSIKLKYFPHITENGKWVMLGKKTLCFYMWDYYFIEAMLKIRRGVVCK